MSTALFTDHYELTMVSSALADGTAQQPCVFEVFARQLPPGRRLGVVAGTGRVLEAVADFRFTDEILRHLATRQVVNDETLGWLSAYRFTGDIDGYREGELYFPGSPIMQVRGTFAEAVVLETLILSILNHDSAVASAAARMSISAGDRPIIEMGGRRTHEEAAVSAARAAYLAGFSSTSNLAAGQRYGIPTGGTAAHAFILLHDNEETAFKAQISQLGTDTTLLVDTYDITAGINTAIRVAGPQLGAIRIDSGDVGVLARQARAQLDSLGAKDTRIVISGDLDEYAIASLRSEPVDAYGVGTSVVTGSGAPTAGMVYKLVEVAGKPVAKRSPHKLSRGGRKGAIRRHRSSGTATEEVIYPINAQPETQPNDKNLHIPLMRSGKVAQGVPTVDEARKYLRQALVSLPWEGLTLSHGEPAIPTTFSE